MQVAVVFFELRVTGIEIQIRRRVVEWEDSAMKEGSFFRNIRGRVMEWEL